MGGEALEATSKPLVKEGSDQLVPFAMFLWSSSCSLPPLDCLPWFSSHQQPVCAFKKIMTGNEQAPAHTCMCSHSHLYFSTVDGVISPILSSLYGASYFIELLCPVLQLGKPSIYSDCGNPTHPLNSAASVKYVLSIPCSDRIWHYSLSLCSCGSRLLQPDWLLGVRLSPARPSSSPIPPAPQDLVSTLRTRVGTLFL